MQFGLIFYLIATGGSLLPSVCNGQNYLLYDIFEWEGFNLRRDVYIRVANLVRLLNQHNDSDHPANWTLVLPPWGPMYHWMAAANQLKGVEIPAKPLPWSTFFDVSSLSELIPVMELDDFVSKVLRLPNGSIGQVDLALQLFRAPLDSESMRKESVEFCSESIRTAYYKPSSRDAGPPITLYPSLSNDLLNDILTATQYDCITGALEPVTLAPFMNTLLDTMDNTKPIRSVYLGSAESIIHGQFSEWSAQYWTVRRSMVFAEKLRDIGDNFRRTYLDSTDVPDHTFPPFPISWRGPGSSWLHRSWPMMPAVGGPYMAVHWRCGDYVSSSGDRWANTPSPAKLAAQIKTAMAHVPLHQSKEINTVFLATDANQTDVDELVAHLGSIKLYRFEPTPERWADIGPGGIAIVDQWICSHARFFLGTSPSTFTFRITEERTIMGFPFSTTFNALCPKGKVALYKEEPSNTVSEPGECEPLTPWPVVYEPAFSIEYKKTTHRPEL